MGVPALRFWPNEASDLYFRHVMRSLYPNEVWSPFLPEAAHVVRISLLLKCSMRR